MEKQVSPGSGAAAASKPPWCSPELEKNGGERREQRVRNGEEENRSWKEKHGAKKWQGLPYLGSDIAWVAGAKEPAGNDEEPEEREDAREWDRRWFLVRRMKERRERWWICEGGGAAAPVAAGNREGGGEGGEIWEREERSSLRVREWRGRGKEVNIYIYFRENYN